MTLNEYDYELFLRLYEQINVFVDNKLGGNANEYLSLPINQKALMRDKLHDHLHLIDDFVKENPSNLPPDYLDIVAGFKHVVTGNFYLVKYLSNYAVFMNDDYAFGVHSLIEPFEYYIPKNYLPSIVTMALLPFKDMIIYDGILASQQIRFGGNIKRRLNQEYNELKAKHGIITQLPIVQKEEETKDEDLLIYYLKNATNRDYYEEEIYQLANKNKDLKAIYHRECGRIAARPHKATIKDFDIKKRHFAVLHDTVVASAKSKKELTQQLETFLTKEQMNWVYYFKV